MGKPIDKNTKNFDELLEHLNKPSDDLDAFEQEALEGFAMLENQQEAIDLKKRLDEKIEKEVLVKKRKPLFIYWSAAAGIALLAGLIFISNNTNSFEKQELAQNAIAQEEQKNLEGMPAASTDVTKVEAVSNAQSLEQNAPGERSDKRSRSGNRREPVISQTNENSEMTLSEKDVNDEAPASKAKEENNADFKKKSEEQPDADDQKKAPSAAPQSATNFASGAGAGENSKISDKNVAKDEEKEAKSDEIVSRKIKKEKNKGAATKAAAPPAEDNKPQTEDASHFEKSNIKTASLTIKENELNKRITQFLSDKSYKKSFVCTLTINNSNEVEEVHIENPEIFKRSEEKELTAFLKKLNCFKSNEYAIYSIYVIKYTSE